MHKPFFPKLNSVTSAKGKRIIIVNERVFKLLTQFIPTFAEMSHTNVFNN